MIDRIDGHRDEMDPSAQRLHVLESSRSVQSCDPVESSEGRNSLANFLNATVVLGRPLQHLAVGEESFA